MLVFELNNEYFQNVCSLDFIMKLISVCWYSQIFKLFIHTSRLINYLKATTLEEDATGGIDSVTLSLVMALLYALDLSILQRREDGERKSMLLFEA
jgi:nuclear pore complex protein Nup205